MVQSLFFKIRNLNWSANLHIIFFDMMISHDVKIHLSYGLVNLHYYFFYMGDFERDVC